MSQTNRGRCHISGQHMPPLPALALLLAAAAALPTAAAWRPQPNPFPFTTEMRQWADELELP